eukprot:scaffold407855_cov16-Prasinocladus_malaysianus.AAC.1
MESASEHQLINQRILDFGISALTMLEAYMRKLHSRPNGLREHKESIAMRLLQDHAAAITKQLLRSEGFNPEGNWLPVVQQLAARAVASICPQSIALYGELDVCFYIK